MGATDPEGSPHDATSQVRTGRWPTDPLAPIVSFCLMVDDVAARLGIDPDRPRHLSKVTSTL